MIQTRCVLWHCKSLVFNFSWASAFQGTEVRAQEREALCSQWPQSPPQAKTVCRCTSMPLNTFISHVPGLHQELLLECSWKLWGRSQDPVLARDTFPWIPQQGNVGARQESSTLGYWSKGSLGQGKSPREIPVSALRSEADTSMCSCACKDAALLLLHHF